jgi:hypothetical protein
MDDSSTHSPLPTLRLALRHGRASSPKSIISIVLAFYYQEMS